MVGQVGFNLNSDTDPADGANLHLILPGSRALYLLDAAHQVIANCSSMGIKHSVGLVV